MFLTKRKNLPVSIRTAKLDNNTIKTCTSQMFDANDSLIPPIHSKTEMSHAII